MKASECLVPQESRDRQSGLQLMKPSFGHSVFTCFSCPPRSWQPRGFVFSLLSQSLMLLQPSSLFSPCSIEKRSWFLPCMHSYSVSLWQPRAILSQAVIQTQSIRIATRYHIAPHGNWFAHHAHSARRPSLILTSRFFHQFGVSQCKVWAWNFEHLRFLLMVLKVEPDNGHPYHGCRAYIQGAWLKRVNLDRIAKEIEKRIARKSVQDIRR